MFHRYVLGLTILFAVASLVPVCAAVTQQNESNILPNGAAFLWIEGEDYLEKQEVPGDAAAVGWVWVTKDDPMLSVDNGEFGNRPILPSDTNASGGEAIVASLSGGIVGSAEATWQVEFMYPGTYWMYMHWSFYSRDGNSAFTNEDSLYVPPAFNANPHEDWIGFEGYDWPTGDPRTGQYERDGYIDGLATPGTLYNVVSKGDWKVHNDARDPDFYYGNFHWFWVDRSSDYDEEGNWKGFNGFAIEYEVSDEMLGQTLDFQIGRREPYGVIDGILFATSPDLLEEDYTQEELGPLVWPAAPENPLCDINLDGVCDAQDIDEMTQRVLDGITTQADRNALISSSPDDGLNTYIGDSDMNGEFSEQDFVAVFIAGKYITGEHAGWAEGDWDGNFLFNEQDFVAAFIDGGYLQGPREAVSAVPEPSCFVLLVLGISVFRRRRHKRVFKT